jgi:hypothetical protein
MGTGPGDGYEARILFTDASRRRYALRFISRRVGSQWQHRLLMCTLRSLALACLPAAALARPCPVDFAGPAGTLLSIRAPAVQHLAAADLGAPPQAERVQRRSVVGESASTPALEQGVRYGGVLLRDVLARSMQGEALRRVVRAATVEAIATDNYRASFSWGELFNSSAGDHVIVITSQDGVALNVEQGPLALRALADTRPGPRHVRNLCALVVRLPETGK